MVKVKDASFEYHNSGYLGKSKLFKIKKSPMHFIHNLNFPPEPTPALVFGRAFHSYVLEPETFNDEFIVADSIDRRTKAGKLLVQEAIDSKKEIISGEDFEKIRKMKESVFNTKYANSLLSGEKETSYYWTDEMTGINVSCRPDCRTVIREGKGIIVDLKSCKSAATEDFMRDAINLGYDVQSAQYKTGVELIEGFEHDFVFIAVEKEPPYGVNILQADPLFIQHGYDLFREYLGIIAECQRTGNWWGYNGENGYLNTLGLPAWLLKEME